MVKAVVLSYELASEYFRYDPITGKIYRLKSKYGGGSEWEVGSPVGIGYLAIQFRGAKYYAHRLAWLLAKKEWPECIDHINRDKKDNRLENLRAVSHAENMQNRARKAPSQYGRGVSKENSRFKASIIVGGKKIRIGLYDTPEEARAAYEEARRLHHPFFTDGNPS